MNTPTTPVMIRVRVTFETFSPDDLEAGEASERGYEDEGGRVFDPAEYADEDDPARAAAEEAARYILNEGGVHPSRSPVDPSENTWWTTDEEPDYYTGERTFRSFHLDGDAAAVAVVQTILAQRTRNTIRK